MKNLLFAIICVISCAHLIAQTKEEPKTTEKKWYVKGALQLSDTQALCIIEHPSYRNGVLMVNNIGTVEWDISIDGCILGISKHNGNVLVFYTAKGTWDKIYNSIDKTIVKINIAILDIKSQKIIDDKVVYNGSQYVIPDIQNDAAGNFSQLLLRSTSRKKPGFAKGFTLITLTANGSVAKKDISSIATEGMYIGNSAGKDGCMFIASIVKGSIVVEKFSHEGMLTGKLESSPLDIHKKSYYNSLMCTDTFTNNAVLLNFRARNKEKGMAFSYFRFNFDDNQVAAVNETPLNKTSSYKFNFVDQLEPIDLLFTNDKIIMVREVRRTEVINRGNGKVSFINHSENVVVSIFDKQMKQIRDIEINKATISFSQVDIGLACRIKKDKLYILSGENKGLGTFENYCYTINLNDGKWEKRKIGSNKPSSSTSIFTQGTIWFANEFVMSHLHIGFGVGIKRYSTELESVGYDTH